MSAPPLAAPFWRSHPSGGPRTCQQNPTTELIFAVNPLFGYKITAKLMDKKVEIA
jgi:hypothetical protein